MFRIRTLPLICFLAIVSPAAAKEPLPLEKHTYKSSDDRTLPYRLLKPTKIENDTRYPLVVFLHGAGERGTENEKQLVHGVPEFASEKRREQYPCFLIAPQCPEGARWVEVDWGADAHKQPEQPSEPMRLTLELIDRLCKELPIDTGRVYITGLSMGGFGAWDAVSRRPDFFAGAVVVCGGGDESRAAKIARVPVWVFHGARDTAVKPSRSRNMVEAIKKAGGEPKYTEYPDVGHASWGPAYRDDEMFKWLFAQRRK